MTPNRNEPRLSDSLVGWVALFVWGGLLIGSALFLLHRWPVVEAVIASVSQ